MKRDICSRRLEDGGLGMINLKIIVRACRLVLLTKILEGGDQKWKILPRMYFKCMDEEYGDTYYVIRDTFVETNIPAFYKECVKAMQVLQEQEKIPESKTDILNQYLWGNPLIQINGKPLSDPHWCKNGIR